MTNVGGTFDGDAPGDGHRDSCHITVVVCAHNEQRLLHGCLESLENQVVPRGVRYEVLVIDDGSVDLTGDIARGWVGIKGSSLFRYAKIRWAGLSAARNTGIFLANGKVIAFMDADARADPLWIAEILRFFDTNRAVGAVGGAVKNFAASGRWFSDFIHQAHYAATTDVASMKLVGTNMAFRAQIFDRMGVGFLNYFTRRGDETAAAVLYEATSDTATVGYAPQAVVYNEHPDRMIAWLRIQFFEGSMNAVLRRHVPRFRPVGPDMAAQLLGRAIGLTAIPVAVALALLGRSSPAGAFFAAGAARHALRGRYLAAGWKRVSESHGLAVAALAPIVVTMGTMSRDAGYVAQFFRWLGGSDDFSRASSKGVIVEKLP